MAELHALLDQAGVTGRLDAKSQIELADGKVPPGRLAERLFTMARRLDATI